MAQCVEIPVNLSPTQPEVPGCVAPQGSIGQTTCIGVNKYTCGPDGSWVQNENQWCVAGITVDTKTILLGAAAVVALMLIGGGGRRNNNDDWEY